MKASLESTEQILEFSVQGPGGVPGPVGKGRLWVGTTESGIPIQALIVRVAVESNHSQEAFERELKAQPAPAPAVQAFPLRMVL